MATRIIRQEGDEILKKKSREVEKIDEKVLELIEDMIETMHKFNGVGLAAVQVRNFKKNSCNRYIQRRSKTIYTN